MLQNNYFEFPYTDCTCRGPGIILYFSCELCVIQDSFKNKGIFSQFEEGGKMK